MDLQLIEKSDHDLFVQNLLEGRNVFLTTVTRWRA